MADQIRLVTIKRGYDPRQFALVVLGGAGPVHGVPLAEEMGMAEVIVPEAPGVLAAFGLLAAAIEHHHARTLQARADAVDLDAVNRCLAELDAAGRGADARGRRAGGERCASRTAADMRYVGQAYELEVPIAAPLTRDARAGGRARVPRRARARLRLRARAAAGRVRQLPRRAPLSAAAAGACGRPRGPAARWTTRASASGARTSRPTASSPPPIYERARLPLGCAGAGPGHRRAGRHHHRDPARRHAALVDDAGNLRLRRAA